MTKPEESMRIIQSSSSKQEVDSETEEFIVETEESPGGGTRATIISGGNSVARYKDDEDEDDLINNSRDERDEEDFDDEFGPSPKRTKGSPSKIKYTQRYKKEWESKPEFKLWLSESVHGNQYFYCKFCKRDNRCGISEIQKHMTSKKHMSRASLPGVTARKFKFRGLLCPVFTPFKSTCHKKMVPEVNFRGIPKYAQFLKACNVQGVFINDYLGEGMALTVQERMQLTEAWMKACSKTEQLLMVQIGGAPLKDIIEMAVHAEKNKVGAVVVLPDLYNRPKNHLDVLRYLKMVSEHTGNIPLLYHHNPKYTQVEIDISAMLLEIPDEIDSFAGLIYTTNDLRECIAASTVNAEKYTVFMGTEEIILGAAASGITCIMANSLNFLPKVVEAIYEESRKGNIKAAQASQSFINKALDVISKHGDPLAAFKAATNIITEEACGNATRAPIQELWEGTVKKLHEEMSKLGII